MTVFCSWSLNLCYCNNWKFLFVIVFVHCERHTGTQTTPFLFCSISPLQCFIPANSTSTGSALISAPVDAPHHLQSLLFLHLSLLPSLPSSCFFTFQLWHRMGPAVLIRGVYLHSPHWLLRSGLSISCGSAPGGPVGPKEAPGTKPVKGCFFPVVSSSLHWHGLHHPGRDGLAPGHLPGTAAACNSVLLLSKNSVLALPNGSLHLSRGSLDFDY